MAIVKNKKASSSGSLIAVLNLIIDNEPTNPNDRASEDLIIDIINVVVEPSNTRLLANFFLFDKVLPYFE